MKDHSKYYDKESLSNRLKNWVGFYLILTTDHLITPYFHTFVNHVLELIRLNKNLNIFSMQSLEYLNIRTKLHFFSKFKQQMNTVTN